MEKVMIVTVGTSLFHSASWNKNIGPFQKILGSSCKTYSRHWAEGAGLTSPEHRRKHDGGLEEILSSAIKADNADDWAQWLAGYQRKVTPVMRYSAEISTILNYSNRQKADEWQAFLQEYTFNIVHDANTVTPTYHAAFHIKAYLSKLINADADEVHLCGIRGFSADQPQPLKEGFKSFGEVLHRARETYGQIDVVISGGFKIYGLAAALFLEQGKFRILYQHEQSDDIVIFDQKQVSIGDERTELPEMFLGD
jgi:hypothetical protein